MAKVVLVTDKPETTAMFKALSSEYRGRVLIGEVLHPRVDARQSQESIPRIYRGIDVKSQFQLPLT